MAEKPTVEQEDIKNPDEEEQPQDTEQNKEEGDLSIEELNKKIAELNEALNKAGVDKAGFIEQIKELRKRAQEAEAAGKVKAEPEPEGDDVEAKVKTILQKEKTEQAKKNRVAALHNFWAKHPEYSPDNDLVGLKMDAVSQSLNRLNTAESISVDEIGRDYEDALRLMKKEEPKKTQADNSGFASEGGVPGSPKGSEDTGKLTSEQEKLRKQKGWTVKKYLEMKAKYPLVIK